MAEIPTREQFVRLLDDLTWAAIAVGQDEEGLSDSYAEQRAVIAAYDAALASREPELIRVPCEMFAFNEKSWTDPEARDTLLKKAQLVAGIDDGHASYPPPWNRVVLMREQDYQRLLIAAHGASTVVSELLPKGLV